MKFSTEILTG